MEGEHLAKNTGGVYFDSGSLRRRVNGHLDDKLRKCVRLAPAATSAARREVYAFVCVCVRVGDALNQRPRLVPFRLVV